MKPLFTRAGNGRPVSWRTLFGIILVPITVAGLFLWGLWNPQERLEDVTAAVVNLDEPVEVDGQLTPLGRVLAGELIGSDDDNFSWQLTDEEDAEDGIENGKYVAVVTIPENFSKAATSVSKGPDELEQAHVDIETSPRGKLLDSAISAVVTETAMKVLNETLGTSFVENIFVGMNQLGDGMREAASGADQLADGGDELASGANQLADGTDQLADGTGQLASGAGELAEGAGQLSGGASELAGGIGQYVDGVDGVATGVGELAGGLSQLDAGLAESAQGASAAADGQQELANGIAGYVDGVNGIAAPIGDALAPIKEQLADLNAQIDGSSLPDDQKERLKELLGQAAEASNQIDGLIEGGEDLKVGAQQGADGGRELATGLSSLSGGLHASTEGAQQLAAGAGQLSGAGSELQTGAQGLAEGTGGLASGAGELASGTQQLADEVPQLAEGAHGIADGTKQTADGARELSDGLAEGANEVPAYSDSGREKMAEAAIAPVKAQNENDKLFRDNGVPLFTSIALWAGGLAAFALIAPLWRRSREAAKGVGSITMRSSISGLVLGAIQGLIAGIVLPLALDYSGTQFIQFLLVSLLAGVSFSLVNQGLVALMGGFGRFISFVMLVVAFAAGVVSTVPGALKSIAEFTPLGTAFNGFQSIATELSGVSLAAFVLVCWALLGLTLIVFAVSRARRAVAPAKSRR